MVVYVVVGWYSYILCVHTHLPQFATYCSVVIHLQDASHTHCPHCWITHVLFLISGLHTHSRCDTVCRTILRLLLVYRHTARRTAAHRPLTRAHGCTRTRTAGAQFRRACTCCDIPARYTGFLLLYPSGRAAAWPTCRYLRLCLPCCSVLVCSPYWFATRCACGLHHAARLAPRTPGSAPVFCTCQPSQHFVMVAVTLYVLLHHSLLSFFSCRGARARLPASLPYHIVLRCCFACRHHAHAAHLHYTRYHARARARASAARAQHAHGALLPLCLSGGRARASHQLPLIVLLLSAS